MIHERSTPLIQRNKVLEMEGLVRIRAAYKSYKFFTAYLTTWTIDFGKNPALAFSGARVQCCITSFEQCVSNQLVNARIVQEHLQHDLTISITAPLLQLRVTSTLTGCCPLLQSKIIAVHNDVEVKLLYKRLRVAEEANVGWLYLNGGCQTYNPNTQTIPLEYSSLNRYVVREAGS